MKKSISGLGKNNEELNNNSFKKIKLCKTQLLHILGDNRKKLGYAKKVLPAKIFNVIGRNNILKLGMTQEKIDFLGSGYLTLEDVISLGGDYITDKGTTINMLECDGYILLSAKMTAPSQNN